MPRSATTLCPHFQLRCIYSGCEISNQFILVNTTYRERLPCCYPRVINRGECRVRGRAISLASPGSGGSLGWRPAIGPRQPMRDEERVLDVFELSLLSHWSLWTAALMSSRQHPGKEMWEAYICDEWLGCGRPKFAMSKKVTSTALHSWWEVVIL